MITECPQTPSGIVRGILLEGRSNLASCHGTLKTARREKIRLSESHILGEAFKLGREKPQDSWCD